jgi:two-component system chemotaxis response regulator CheY
MRGVFDLPLRFHATRIARSSFMSRQPMTLRARAGEETPRQMARILVVEDSAMMKLYYTQVLAGSHDWQVSFVKNGQEALDQIASKGPPDVVVLDLNMPVMDGFEFLARFKGPSGTPSRVIIVSGDGRREDFDRGLAAGASACLKKPFKPEELQRLLRELVPALATQAG